MLHFGPGHVVWEDENFDTRAIEACIRDAGRPDQYDLSDADFAIAIRSLKELLAVPETIRDCCPKDYEGEHPENFPPPPALHCARER